MKTITIKIENGKIMLELSEDMTLREVISALEAAMAQVLSIVIKARGGGE